MEMKRIIVLLVFVFTTFFSASAGIVKISGSLIDFKIRKVDIKNCGISLYIDDR